MEFIGKCSCLYCRELKSIKGIHTHVERTHFGSTKYSSGNNGKYKQISDATREKRNLAKIEYLKKPNYCKECNAELNFEKRLSKFCSRSCSASFNNRGKISSLEKIRKISETLTGKKYIAPHYVTSTCKCGESFTYEKKSYKERQYCSHSCAIKFSPANIERHNKSRLNKTKLQNYRSDCDFKFNLKDYIEEFDFSLIEKFGWYKAKNKGDNLNGVSRDHMVSVKYGFENDIDPSIISHPANCKLMRHNENVSKHKSCSLTIDELLERIKMWNIKYNTAFDFWRGHHPFKVTRSGSNPARSTK